MYLGRDKVGVNLVYALNQVAVAHFLPTNCLNPAARPKYGGVAVNNTTRQLQYLAEHIRYGTLNLFLPDGTQETLGQGPPAVDWVMHTDDALERILHDPQTNISETFLDNEWTTQADQLATLIELLLINLPTRASSWMWRRFVPLQSWLTAPSEYVSHTGEIHRNANAERDMFVLERILDQDMHHSCAYYTDPQISLEEAQRAKCRHIMTKLCLEPGHHVLDIYCGFGAFALFLAENADVRVTGLARTPEQLHRAQLNAIERNLHHRVNFLLEDYRQHQYKYDRIVSIEASDIGQPAYRPFFNQLTELMRPNSLAVFHSVGHSRPSNRDTWIAHRSEIQFPYPTLSSLMQSVENESITVVDVEIWRMHYALTFAAWQQRLQRCRDEIADRLDERSCRIWEFYLALSEALFRCRGLAVFEIQLAQRQTAVPITRDYLYRKHDDHRERIIVQPLNGALRINVKK